MDSNLISVVVPAYNIAPWIGRCLDSILAQTYENLEVIVVNDGSTDDTKAVLDACAAGHTRVTVIHKENGGVTSARLRGIREAKGGWIGFIDGDDTIEETMYARLLHLALEQDADIAHCGHQVHFPDGRVEKVHGTGKLRVQDHLTGLRDLLDGGEIESSLCTKLYRRELFEGLEDWMDPSIKNNEDLLMNYHLFARAKGAVYEDVCPYRYLLRTGSASYNQFNRHSLFDPIRVREKMLAASPEELRSDTRRALLRNLLFIYGQLALNLDPQYDGFRAEVREKLQEQREHFSLLSNRNKILANMICFAPWSFHLAFSMYVKLFRREEEH